MYVFLFFTVIYRHKIHIPTHSTPALRQINLYRKWLFKVTSFCQSYVNGMTSDQNKELFILISDSKILPLLKFRIVLVTVVRFYFGSGFLGYIFY